MSTPEFERWQGLDVRRPDDVRDARGGPIPLSWQMDKRQAHSDRLANNALPADFPHPVERGDAGDTLAVLALGESMRRDLTRWRAIDIRAALLLGATWTEVGAALDASPDYARGLLRDWADGQHHLYETDVAEGRAKPLGLDDAQHAAMLALTDLADDEQARKVG